MIGDPMTEMFDTVRSRYGARAEEYIRLLGRIDHAARQDIELITHWAGTLTGTVEDVGCD